VNVDVTVSTEFCVPDRTSASGSFTSALTGPASHASEDGAMQLSSVGEV